MAPITKVIIVGSTNSVSRGVYLARRLQYTIRSRAYATQPELGQASIGEKASKASASAATLPAFRQSSSVSSSDSSKITKSIPSDWEDNPDLNISQFHQLPQGTNFGINQHMVINDAFKEVLRQIPWQFKAPIRYAFAYGSGVFPQSSSKNAANSSSSKTSIHKNPPLAVIKNQGGTPKMIDFIFGVSHSQHWHSLNLKEHRDHYSALGSLGSAAVTHVQDKWGAGVYFHPYITVNGILIKYGVVNIDTICTDLSEWSTLYIAGRLHKPVKILRDDARVRLANQINLISALRTALLMLPPTFTERELYGTIANISYMGDPRMRLPTEDPSKVDNIVGNNLPNFRHLYAPLIENLPNVDFNDSACANRSWYDDPTANVRLEQDMSPMKRGNMVRRLPKAFRKKLYFEYQKKYQIPQLEFEKMMEESNEENTSTSKARKGGSFEQRIANEPPEHLRNEVRGVIKSTIGWPSTSQSLKGILTGGLARTYRYMNEKMQKHREGTKKAKEVAATAKEAIKTGPTVSASKSGNDQGKKE